MLVVCPRSSGCVSTANHNDPVAMAICYVYSSLVIYFVSSGGVKVLLLAIVW